MEWIVGIVLVFVVTGLWVTWMANSYRKRRAKILAECGDPRVADEIMRRRLLRKDTPSRVVAPVTFVFSLTVLGFGLLVMSQGPEMSFLAMLFIFGGALGAIGSLDAMR